MSVINPVISQVIRPVTQPPTKPPKGGGGGNPALTRDLEAWWDMSGAALNANETDSTGNYDLEKAGAASLSSSTSTFRTGRLARVTSNSGANYLRESAGAAPAVLQPSGDFTFFIWARPSDTVTRNLCGVWDETGDERAWRILHNSTGWRFEICGDGTAGDVTALQSSTGGALTWAFICVTRKNNTISLYVNDDAAVTGSFSGSMHTSTALFLIGQVQDSADAGFYGTTQNSSFDTAAMWSRALRARDINERATSLYAGGAGYAYADIGNVKGYASLAAAESSGDNWKNGEVIRCVSGSAVTDYKYFSSIAGNHSGLIHRYPMGDTTEITEPSVTESLAAEDPDSYSPAWTDSGVGTKGVDYDYVFSGGLAQFQSITGSGTPDLKSSISITTADATKAFWIGDSVSTPRNNNAADRENVILYYKRGASDEYVMGLFRNGGTTWTALYENAGSGGFDDTGIDVATATRVWMYGDGANCAYWFDNAAAPAVSRGTRETAVAGTTQHLWIRTTAASAGSAFRVGYHLSGKW